MYGPLGVQYEGYMDMSCLFFGAKTAETETLCKYTALWVLAGSRELVSKIASPENGGSCK